MWQWEQFFFAEFKRRTHESYPQLFSGEAQTGILSNSQAFSEKWGFYSSLYCLSSGDVTKFEAVEKLNLQVCLTWLVFEKEKNELERQINKNGKRKTD